MTKTLFGSTVVAILLCLFLTCTASAQTIVTGGFSGTITDPTGAIVPEATLTLTNSSTGESFVSTSTATGGYAFSLLKPGDYALVIKKDGFKTTSRKVSVLLGQNLTINVAMELGASTTTIEVTGEGALLQTKKCQHRHNL